ncbi:MAG: beta-N-acetylhexosaminidase [Verrucomicrobia bacterium]|nr:MAG: beta-N-acetylhexosaminidase [Verrucomicrobiota bacterium]
MKRCSRPAIAGLTLGLLATLSCPATPAIIPLPVTLQTKPGSFTLCPNQPVLGVPARATRKIFTDPPSFQTGQYLSALLFRSTGFQFVVSTNNAGTNRGGILLTTANAMALGAEGYELIVQPDSVVIRAPAQGGVFYGVQSFLQLLPPQIMSQQPVTNVAWVAPCVYIQDQPRFGWRGVMLDVSRHFVDKQEVEKILDGLALHKINIFHWHLCDDHGWRLHINSWPNLTIPPATNTAACGAWRTGIDYNLNPAASTAYNSLGQYGGFYTQDDIREVVAYAQQRHITVVPELEFPAHCTAALVAYPQLGCGNPNDSSHYNMDQIHYGFTLFSLANSGTFFTNVLTEVMSLFPGPYIHCGGDEVIATGDTQWTSYTPDVNLMNSLGINPAGGSTSIRQYQRYLSINLTAFLKANGRTFCGWSEIEDAGTITNAILHEWTTDKGTLTASNGQQVVMCPNGINYYQIPSTGPYKLYDPFFEVGSSPAYKTISDVYNYEPVPSTMTSSPYATNIIGAQVNLWTEFVPSGLNDEYKIYPRICAEAEVGWTQKAQKNYTDFTNRLFTVGNQRLAAMGLNYNRETITQIGSWGPSVSTTPVTVSYTITPYVSKAGEIDVSFAYTSGSDGINVYSVALLENGIQVDINGFTSFAGAANYVQTPNALGGIACYAVHLPAYHPGSTYTIQASMAENGTAASSNGNVYLPNWN